MPSTRPSAPRPGRAALARLSGALILVAALAGGAAAPAARALDAGAQWANAHEAPLPPELLAPPDLQATRIYAADGRTLITTFNNEDRNDVSLAGNAPVMKQANVAAEDPRFYSHG